MAAQPDGLFTGEIVPVTVPSRKGDTVVDTDEHPRPDMTMESLGSGVRYGLETMCIGGGQGLAAVFERVTS